MAASESSGKCFNCHELGHWAKNCPSDSSQGQVQYVSPGNVSSGKCFKCQQLGHWSNNCPNNSTQEVPQFSLGIDVIPPKMCICPRQCLILTSKTSANPGRKFYKCYQNADSNLFVECNFFEWCDDLEASASQNPNPSSQSPNLNPSSELPNLSPNSQSRIPNPGLSSPSNNRSPYPSHSSPANNPNCNPNSPIRNPNTGAHEELGSQQQFVSIMCECEAGPCRLLTAQTEKNKGRLFFSCPIKKGEGSCGFFKWYDKLDSAASSSIKGVRSEPEESVR